MSASNNGIGRRARSAFPKQIGRLLAPSGAAANKEGFKPSRRRPGAIMRCTGRGYLGTVTDLGNR